MEEIFAVFGIFFVVIAFLLFLLLENCFWKKLQNKTKYIDLFIVTINIYMAEQAASLGYICFYPYIHHSPLPVAFYNSFYYFEGK